MRDTEGGMAIKPWDIGAAGLLVRQASGRATSAEGDEKFPSTGIIVVSNGLLYEQILRVLCEGDDAPAKVQLRAGPRSPPL